MLLGSLYFKIYNHFLVVMQHHYSGFLTGKIKIPKSSSNVATLAFQFWQNFCNLQVYRSHLWAHSSAYTHKSVWIHAVARIEYTEGGGLDEQVLFHTWPAFRQMDTQLSELLHSFEFHSSFHPPLRLSFWVRPETPGTSVKMKQHQRKTRQLLTEFSLPQPYYMLHWHYRILSKLASGAWK